MHLLCFARLGGRISRFTAVNLRYEWRIYVGAEEADPREYRQILETRALREDDPAPACVSVWCTKERFEFHEELVLKSCPDGLEDALTLLLSMAFEKMGKGDWVQPPPLEPYSGALVDGWLAAV